jgi:hypothetical protein
MFEYKKIQAELEDFKCPKHGKSAIVSFKEGKMVLESVCCEEHKKFLLEKLTDISQKGFTDILVESVSGM